MNQTDTNIMSKGNNTDSTNAIDHPQHYGGELNPYEAIKVIESWNLGFCLGNTIKYIARAGKKNKVVLHDGVHSTKLEDLKKAAWYLNREIENIESQI